MAVPTAPDWAADEDITEAKLDSISTVLNFLMAPPRCFAYKSGDGSLAHNTWSAGIAMNSEAYDSHGMHDASTNNSRVAAPENGLYHLDAGARFEANATGSRRFQLRKNAAGSQAGGTLLRYITLNAVTGGGNETDIFASFDLQLVAGDYVEMFLQQTSGGPLSVLGLIDGTFLSLRWEARTV